MPQVRSNIHTDVAFDGGAGARAAGVKHRVVLVPGLNDLTDKDMDLLAMDAFFPKQEKAGYFTVLDNPVLTMEPGAAPAPAAPAPGSSNDDPRAQRRGESKAAWTARVAKLDADAAPANDPALATLVSDFFAMGVAEQDAMYPTLSDAEKAAVDKARPAP